MVNDNDVLIMMVTYNRLNLTKQTFETTMLNTGCKYNLVIVDNNSQDETVDYLNNICSKNELINKYKIIKLKQNMGIAYGRNLCLKVLNEEFKETKYLCTLDNDIILQDNWLKKCIDVINNDLVLACGVNLEGCNYPKTKIKTNNGYEEIQIKPKGNLGTACTVFKSEVHHKLGYFDKFECYGHEDALWFYRMRMLDNKKILSYLSEPGIHLGVAKEDSGEYRDMKNKYWDINMQIFNKLIREYANGIRPLYLSFEETCQR